MKARARRGAAPRWHSCNVLQLEADGRQLWQFTAGNNQVNLHHDLRVPLGEPLPAKPVAKDWRTLYQAKLNIAWLPADQAFLRVLRLPRGTPEELPAMLELQLEKLSPLPVNQIVWSFENLSRPEDEQQTVVLVVAQRAQVEQFLGVLEKDGFVADRLVLPLLNHLAAQPPTEDGTWIYLAQEGPKVLGLVAWWFGGALRNLNLIQAPDDPEVPRILTDHLTRISWAGEIEGWLNTQPTWHLVADPARVAAWEPALRAWAGGAMEWHAAPSPKELATLSASRGARHESQANLLPPEFGARYRQQFVDRLWMRGLAVLTVLYLLGVLVYFAGVEVLKYRRDKVQHEVARLSVAYTNALTLKERLRVFQEQASLKYAALDCWKTAAELLPTELTLESFNFQGGKTLFLAGSVSRENQGKVTEYNAELSKATVNNTPLFNKGAVQPPKFTPKGADQYRWDFTADLNQNWLE